MRVHDLHCMCVCTDVYMYMCMHGRVVFNVIMRACMYLCPCNQNLHSLLGDVSSFVCDITRLSDDGEDDGECQNFVSHSVVL